MADASLVDRLRGGDHLCWSFDDDAERRRVAAAYVSGGLRDRHRILYLTAAVDPDTALAELASGGVDARAAAGTGQLRVACAWAAYLGDGVFDPAATDALWRAEVVRARREGHAGVRALGDMAWAAGPAPGVDRLPEYEARVNRMYADGYAMAVCLYDRRLFGAEALARVARTHPATITPRTSPLETPLLRMVRRGGCLAVCGEVDLSNRDAFRAVLSHAIEDSAAGTVTLDLTGLLFADATAVELIVATGRAAAGRFRVAGARPPVRRLLALQGAGAIPGLLMPGPPRAPTAR
jgi:anti-anti-sigma factor